MPSEKFQVRSGRRLTRMKSKALVKSSTALLARKSQQVSGCAIRYCPVHGSLASRAGNCSLTVYLMPKFTRRAIRNLVSVGVVATITTSCVPPARQSGLGTYSSSGSAGSDSSTTRSSGSSSGRRSSVQCSDYTKKGNRCLRMTTSSNGRCYSTAARVNSSPCPA